MISNSLNKFQAKFTQFEIDFKQRLSNIVKNISSSLNKFQANSK